MPRVTTNPDSYAEVCEKKFLALYEEIEHTACYQFHDDYEARKFKRLCRVMYTTGMTDGVKLVYDSLPPEPKSIISVSLPLAVVIPVVVFLIIVIIALF